jgi:hypothetical protein
VTLQSLGFQEEPKGVLPIEGIDKVQGKRKKARPRGGRRGGRRPRRDLDPCYCRERAFDEAWLTLPTLG